MDGSGSAGPAVRLSDFQDFLRRLHDGPPQHAAAVKVAIAVWQGALDRGDTAGARDALELVRQELDRLIESIAALQAHGRRLAGEDA